MKLNVSSGGVNNGNNIEYDTISVLISRLKVLNIYWLGI
jgi:hypothetical protein